MIQQLDGLCKLLDKSTQQIDEQIDETIRQKELDVFINY
jgi:hypothetical protein